MNRKSGRILGPFRIAFLYLGDVIGAGFASGRETWQYFGIFGKNAVSGIAIATFLFASMGVMTAYLAEKLDTADMGKIILPVRSELASDVLGRVTAFIIYIALISMSAAGGSLLNQQLGFPVPVGGAIVVFLVIVTMLGDFERVSAVFTYVIPILFLAVAGVSFYVFAAFEPAGNPITTKPAAMASTWYVSGAVYVAYNIIGTVPINAKSSLHAKSRGSAMTGVILGGCSLGLLGLLLTLALQKDASVADALDLPMLGFADKISPALGVIFAAVLFVSIYLGDGNLLRFLQQAEKRRQKEIQDYILCSAGIPFGSRRFQKYSHVCLSGYGIRGDSRHNSHDGEFFQGAYRI